MFEYSSLYCLEALVQKQINSYCGCQEDMSQFLVVVFVCLFVCLCSVNKTFTTLGLLQVR